MHLLITLVCTLHLTHAFAQQTDAQERNQRAKEYFTDERVVDQDGKEYRFYTDLIQNNIVLINVVYTNCKDACPMITRHLSLVRSRLSPELKAKILFLSISVDPERDSTHALKAFAVKQMVDDSRWRFLSAKPEALKNILSRLGQWVDDPETHGTLLIAGNAAKAHWKKLRADHSPEHLSAELALLASDN